MTWVHEFESDSGELLAEPCLPRRVLRHLLLSHDVGPASRVLVAGCSDGELVRDLDRLGLMTVGYDESAEQIRTARSLTPHLELICGPADHPLRLAEREFDLVIVRELSVYRHNLHTAEAYGTTAALLACVKPGGHLVFLTHWDAQAPGLRLRHAPACYASHLGQLPGLCTTAEFVEGLGHADAWKRVLGGGVRAGYLITTLRLPSEPISRVAWQHLAEAAAHSAPETCCPATLSLAQVVSCKRSAA